MSDAAQLIAALADRLGDVLTPKWRSALMVTPRHYFVPGHGWRVGDDGGEPVAVDRAADPDGWLEAVYSDDVIITQRDDRGRSTSSCSMPFMVMSMLSYLDVQPDSKVLEIGTGTGWTAALLANYTTSQRGVFTVEVDPHVAAQATANLRSLGLTDISAVVSDGAQGFAATAPFDRIIATCTVNKVPYQWVEQICRKSGVILTPWGTPLHNGALLRLEAGEPGTAQGRFVATSAFMWLRAQQFTAPDEPDDFAQLAKVSEVDMGLLGLLLDGNAMFTAGLLVPDCKVSFDYTDTRDIDTVWMLAADSWASANKNGAVRQHGARRLWDEAASAFACWKDWNGPDLKRYGVTVTGEHQTVWLDEPANVVSEIKQHSWGSEPERL